jgi:hypothetical protein
MRWLLVAALIAVVSAPLALAAPVTFSVTLDPAAKTEAASGRLVVFLIKDGARLRPGQEPADGPFWDDPQPLFGADVKDLKPGTPATLDDGATFFPDRPSALPPGTYRAQAALIVSRTTSSWRSEAGNFTSDVVSFTLAPDRAEPLAVALTLKNPTEPAAGEAVAGVEYVEVRSELLSAFRGRDVFLRAGVVKPKDFDEARTYPAVYEVPGFGGRHFDAARVHGRLHSAPPGSPAAVLAASAFWIVLDPESPNGHTLFTDSANNGPRGACSEGTPPAGGRRCGWRSRTPTSSAALGRQRPTRWISAGSSGRTSTTSPTCSSGPTGSMSRASGVPRATS